MNKDNDNNKIKEPVSFSRLEKEIKIEEESRKLNNIENFKKSQKPKKKLKNKIIAWILGGAIFAGAGTGVGLYINDKTNGDGAYNDAIQTRYEQVDEKLTERLIKDTSYSYLINKEITHVRFLEPEEESANVQVYYKGTISNEIATSDRKAYAIFNVLIDYYNALVEAEASGNALYYLDALDEVFTNMTFVEQVISTDVINCNLRDSSEAVAFNDIFNLNDVENDDIVRQVGFLPYHIEVVDYHYNEETFVTDYTYKIYGVSYCETKSENNDKILQHEDLILESDYNKNNIKTFNREILYTSSCYNEGGITLHNRLSGDIWMIIDGVNSPYTIKTTLFKEIDLMKIYEDVKDGDFDYKKPKDFNVKEYVKNMEEMENVK